MLASRAGDRDFASAARNAKSGFAIGALEISVISVLQSVEEFGNRLEGTLDPFPQIQKRAVFPLALPNIARKHSANCQNKQYKYQK